MGTSANSRVFPNAAVALFMTVLMVTSAAVIAQGNSGGGSGNGNGNSGENNRLQSIEDKLDQVNTKLDELLGPQVTATFCISQGRALDLAAKWAVEAPVEWEGGVGWSEVAKVKATWKPTHPMPTGLPTEAGIQVGGNLGRAVNICVDLPLQLGPEDTAMLLQLAGDINAKPDDGLAGGKFQRRTHRLLNYTKRRVPGVQMQAAFVPGVDSPLTALDEPAAEDEFDRVDTAIDNLTSGGIVPRGEIIGVFHDANIVDLLASMDGLPVDVNNVISKPERVFDSLEDYKQNIGDLKCDAFGVTAELRGERPGLDRLCDRLDGLPSYDAVENVLSGQLLDGIAELIQPLLQNTSGVSESAVQTKNRFCASVVGQRRLFDKYCGR
jgi:hypothetical protein